MEGNQSEQYLADVVVGARGWLHGRWMESFYPEDIPEDWRLGFYANEFNTLLVPWTQWSESVNALEEGLDDTANDFHLYLELPNQFQLLPAHLRNIKDHVTGLVCVTQQENGWQAEAENLKINLLTPITKNNDIFQYFTSNLLIKKPELVLLDSTKINDLAMMREQLEIALKDTEARLDFIFTDEEPDMEAMQNTQMIAELMGA